MRGHISSDARGDFNAAILIRIAANERIEDALRTAFMRFAMILPTIARMTDGEQFKLAAVAARMAAQSV